LNTHQLELKIANSLHRCRELLPKRFQLDTYAFNFGLCCLPTTRRKPLLEPLVQFRRKRDNTLLAATAANRQAEIAFPSLHGSDTFAQMRCNLFPRRQWRVVHPRLCTFLEITWRNARHR
jgi:hypothetical protein